ncbi:MAG: ATP-binding protein [Chlorobiaceae bacterium]|jgi:serine/threonine-protein kinase RsbW|nr:ATP-binding protein [Chlorobiaceae bacterium]
MTCSLSEITVSANVEKLYLLNGFIGQYAEASGCEMTGINRVLLAVEEAFVNICRYAYPGHRGEVTISCRLENGSLVVVFADKGIPFNMLSIPDPDLSIDMDERSPGGLGIHIIRQLTSRVLYRRENGSNVLTLIFSSIRTTE